MNEDVSPMKKMVIFQRFAMLLFRTFSSFEWYPQINFAKKSRLADELAFACNAISQDNDMMRRHFCFWYGD